MIFQLDTKQIKQIVKWIEEHDPTCPNAKGKDLGAIGGRFTYCFTNTGLGQIAVVKCHCGGEINVTDFDNW